MRRASVAIPSNIAEGQKRGHQKDFLRFLHISYASGAELETQIEICKKLEKMKKLNYTTVDKLLEDTMKMLNSLIRSAITRQHRDVSSSIMLKLSSSAYLFS